MPPRLTHSACVALVVALVACGGGSGEGPSTPSNSPLPSTPTERPLPNGIHVSPTGDDSAAGTLDAPLRNIETVLARLAPGLVLVLLDGSWSLSRHIVVRKSGRPARADTPRAHARELPSWLTPELVSTGAARDRLRAQASACLLDEGLIVGVGWSALVWLAQFKTPPSAVLKIVNISGASHDPEEVLVATLHEAAHAWLLPEPLEPMPAEDAYSESAHVLLAAGKRPEFMHALVRDRERVERQADALAATWGGRLRSSDGRAGDSTRAAAARRLQKFG